MWFLVVVAEGATYSKIEDLSICPPNIVLDLFHFVVIHNNTENCIKNC